jgi:hypothetical protein
VSIQACFFLQPLLNVCWLVEEPYLWSNKPCFAAAQH